jgi:hypothetical protein
MNEPNASRTMGQTPGAIVKAATPTPGGFIKNVIAQLIAEYGYDAVRYVVEKLRPTPKKPATGAASVGLAMLALVALGKHGRSSKQRHGGKGHGKGRRR